MSLASYLIFCSVSAFPNFCRKVSLTYTLNISLDNVTSCSCHQEIDNTKEA
jgi:hypothetical protein